MNLYNLPTYTYTLTLTYFWRGHQGAKQLVILTISNIYILWHNCMSAPFRGFSERNGPRVSEKGKHVRKCELKGRPKIWDNEIVGHEMLDEVRKKLRPN